MAQVIKQLRRITSACFCFSSLYFSHFSLNLFAVPKFTGLSLGNSAVLRAKEIHNSQVSLESGAVRGEIQSDVLSVLPNEFPKVLPRANDMESKKPMAVSCSKINFLEGTYLVFFSKKLQIN